LIPGQGLSRADL